MFALIGFGIWALTGSVWAGVCTWISLHITSWLFVMGEYGLETTNSRLAGIRASVSKCVSRRWAADLYRDTDPRIALMLAWLVMLAVLVVLS